jgi:hypothetical protein
LTKAHEKGIRNVEMESAAFAAFCRKAGTKGAVVCATLLVRTGPGCASLLACARHDPSPLCQTSIFTRSPISRQNRLDADQVTAGKDELHEYSLRSQVVVIRYLQRHVIPGWKQRALASKLDIV